MNSLKPPSELCLEGNVAENWRKFKQRFEIYLVASGIAKKDDSIQAMTFLHVIGADALEIYNTFQWENDDDKEKLNPIMQQFEDYCIPRCNLTWERNKFLNRCQEKGERFDAFLTDLKLKSKTCELGSLCDSLITDRIISGIRDRDLGKRLLKEKNLSLEKAIDMCRAEEAAEAQVKDIVPGGGIEEEKVHAVAEVSVFSVGSSKSYAPKTSAVWSVIDTVGVPINGYDREFVNTGDFNGGNGKFTAPSPGFYFFNFNGRKPHGKSCNLQLRKNGKVMTVVESTDKGAYYEAVSQSIILELNEGDEVWITTFFHTDFGVNSDVWGTYITFSGYKIQ